MTEEILKLEKSISHLTPTEELEFRNLEEEALEINDSFLIQARRFGEILDLIKDKGYYKKQSLNHPDGYKDYDSYLRAVFGRGRATIFNYQRTAEIMNFLEANGYDPYDLRTVNNALILYKEVKNFFPHKEMEKRQFEKLARKLTLESWKLIIQTAPKFNKEPYIDQEHIETVFQTIKSVISTNAVVLDGEQIPLSLAALSFNEEVTETVYERIQTQKQIILDEKLNRKKNMFEPKLIENLKVIEETVARNQWKIICPKDGDTTILYLTNSGFKANCGCLGSLELCKNGESKFIWYLGKK